jgi:RNA polymerase sigma-70 factor (ECF subfamily)
MDHKLLVRARAGDREAFDAIVIDRGEFLFRTALAILGSEADARDATQETLVNAWRKLGTLRDLDRFDAWLGRTLVNQCRMALRHRRRVRELPMTDETARFAWPGRAAETPGGTESTDFDRAFERLNAEQRAMLVLHHLHGYGVAEIGAWLGIPTGTVKWRLSRARAALRRELGDD